MTAMQFNSAAQLEAHYRSTSLRLNRGAPAPASKLTPAAQMRAYMEALIAGTLEMSTLVGPRAVRTVLLAALRAVPGEDAAPITIDTVEAVVAEHCQVSLIDIHSARRAYHVVRARQLAVYLALRLTRKNNKAVSSHFDLNHTTVSHACRAVRERLCDPSYAAELDRLEAMIRDRADVTAGAAS
ncbi:helix-turn-helix domain-containing protein [Xanthobacter sp. DSM 24535]|uniref:helix-turn-helix domain-containing protein n=1 Tax=Roseixanthobacter psychrophilus TaxID=3119917 RepID=UPI0037280B88